MTTTSRPSTTDIVLHIGDGNVWRVECPTRQRGKLAIQGSVGLISGTLLAAVGVTGVYEAIVHPMWGARMFLIGWLAPLGVIGALIVWFSVRTVLRLWQVDVIESDGLTLKHMRVGGPFEPSMQFDLPLNRIEPFDPPNETDFPELADPEARAATRGPMTIRYRVANEETVYTHAALFEIACDEQMWIADAVNPLILRERAE